MLNKGEILLKREGDTLIAVDQESLDRLHKMKAEQVYLFTLKKKKNYKFHKKFFSMLTLGFDNQDHFDNMEWFREHALIGAGHCETFFSPTGETLYKAKSIAFAKTTAEEFEIVYQNVLSFLMRTYGYDQSFVDQLLAYGN